MNNNKKFFGGPGGGFSKKPPGRRRQIKTVHGDLELPAFLPDATRAVVRTIDSRDIKESGIQCLMVNAIHLSSHPGISVIKSHGGIHQFMKWDGPIFSDSGGFQVFSLIESSAKMGSVTKRGFVYRLEKGGKKQLLTPEKSIQKQFQIGTDVMFCLDYCTHPDANFDLQRESVEITIQWAKKSKQEFDRQLNNRETTGKRPLLFAVIQGGNDKQLRKMCCERLFEIGFDGYGYGGWPVDKEGNLVEAVEMVAEWVPSQFPLHGLGIGKPESIVRAFQMGYNIFDCVLPTRDARHRRLYVYNDKIEILNLTGTDFYDYLYIQDKKFVRDSKPVDPFCDCFCCRNYSRDYLHHLLKIEEPLANRLATIHNLRFYSRLIERIGGAGNHGGGTGPRIRADRVIVFQRLKESKKYKYLCDDTLNRITDWALERYEPKKAEKAAKNKLHQVYGAYFEKMNIKKIQKEIDKLPSDPDNTALKAAAIEIMKHHTAASERIPFMEQFYSDLFSRIGKPQKILDFACGLNPFSVPWMPLQPDTEYIAFDIDHRLISLINIFFNRLKKTYKAECADILVSIPETKADVVFLLKTLPCLEQQEKGFSEKIIKELKTKYIVISFPLQSLTGKEKGMGTYYRQFIVEILDKLGLKYFQLEYPNEFFYLVKKGKD